MPDLKAIRHMGRDVDVTAEKENRPVSVLDLSRLPTLNGARLREPVSER